MRITLYQINQKYCDKDILKEDVPYKFLKKLIHHSKLLRLKFHFVLFHQFFIFNKIYVFHKMLKQENLTQSIK